MDGLRPTPDAPWPRRTFLASGAAFGLATGSGNSAFTGIKRIPKIAALVTTYFHNSHADLLVGRFLEGYTLDRQGSYPAARLVSMYVDQFPQNDKARRLAGEFGFQLAPTIADALTLGSPRLAVDGVLLIAEQGTYPANAFGSTVYPKRRFFEETVNVFSKSDTIVPLFFDKHLADNWTDTSYIYRTCRKRYIPILAGSVLPLTWRHPAADVGKNERLREVLVLSFHTLDTYGFHALEALQALAEQRLGGETGVAAVACLTGDAVWEAGRAGTYSQALLEAAYAKLRHGQVPFKELTRRVPQPVLWQIEYLDGLRASVLTLNGAVGEWAAAWKNDEEQVLATAFNTDEHRPLMHFTYQVHAIEHLLYTGQLLYPVERTYLTSGLLAALLECLHQGGERRLTPHLHIAYPSTGGWKQPPPPPPPRPLQGQ